MASGKPPGRCWRAQDWPPLAKKGLTVEVLEWVRRIGPNKQGGKGSYTIYRLAEETKC